MPHEVIGGMDGLDAMTALRLAVTIRRARKRWREARVEELLRSMNTDEDGFGVGRVITLLASMVVEG